MAETKLNAREKARLEEEKKDRQTRTKFILVGILVVVMIALVVFVNSRLFYNSVTALKVGDTSYSVARMNYEYQKAYMSIASTYSQYGLIDTSTSLKEQTCMFDADGGTWDDYLKDYAETNMTQFTALYDAAVDAGYTLTDEESEEIDSSIENYRTYGKSLGYPNLNKFLSAYFGTGNSEKTVRSNMAQELIVSRYQQDLYDSYTYTDDELDAYYTENADSYDRVNVLYTLISATANEDEGIDEDAAMEAAENTAEEILANAGSTEEEFSEAVLSATESEANSTSYTVSTFLSRYEGDVTKEDIADGYVFTHSTDSGVYVVYIQSTDDNNYNTVNVRHILIQAVDSDEDGEYSDEEKQTAYDAVKAIEDEWLAGDATEDSFAALANEKSEDTGSNTNGGLYENIYKGEMVDEFNDFCFGDREVGDYAIVYGESSSYCGYHLVYFSGEGQLYTRILAENTMRQNSYSDAVSALAENYTTTETSGWRYVMAD